MTRIATFIARTIATAALRQSWAVLNHAERMHAQGERLEAWATHVAVRWGCVDDMLHAVTDDVLSSR
ncbi:MAG: hypothetical protein ACREEK_07660 [Bradyrhizobium sp.]